MFDRHLSQDQVIRRKDIQPSQAEDQEHFGGPFADAFDGREAFDHFVVLEFVQGFVAGFLREEGLRDIADIARLLRTDPECPVRLRVDLRQRRRVHQSSHIRLQPCAHGIRRLGRHQLADDAVDQAFEIIIRLRQRDFAGVGDDPFHDRIHLREVFQGFLDTHVIRSANV